MVNAQAGLVSSDGTSRIPRQNLGAPQTPEVVDRGRCIGWTHHEDAECGIAPHRDVGDRQLRLTDGAQSRQSRGAFNRSSPDGITTARRHTDPSSICRWRTHCRANAEAGTCPGFEAGTPYRNARYVPFSTDWASASGCMRRNSQVGPTSSSRDTKRSSSYTDVSGIGTWTAGTPTRRRAISASGQRSSVRTSNVTDERGPHLRHSAGALSPSGNVNCAARRSCAPASLGCSGERPLKTLGETDLQIVVPGGEPPPST